MAGMLCSFFKFIACRKYKIVFAINFYLTQCLFTMNKRCVTLAFLTNILKEYKITRLSCHEPFIFRKHRGELSTLITGNFQIIEP